MPEQSSPLLKSVHEGVMTLVMNRPERRNALSPELYDQLGQALLQAKDNQQLGAIVLTGAGEAFCAGGDVARMANSPAETLSFEQKVARLRRRNQIAELLRAPDYRSPSPAIFAMPMKQQNSRRRSSTWGYQVTLVDITFYRGLWASRRPANYIYYRPHSTHSKLKR